jgi:hypothetical protein
MRRRGGLGLVDGGEDGAHAHQEFGTRFGQRHAARRAMEQPYPQPLLQRLQAPRQDGRVAPDTRRRPGEGARLGDGREGRHFGKGHWFVGLLHGSQYSNASCKDYLEITQQIGSLNPSIVPPE